jgi:hypothetical protein
VILAVALAWTGRTPEPETVGLGQYQRVKKQCQEVQYPVQVEERRSYRRIARDDSEPGRYRSIHAVSRDGSYLLRAGRPRCDYDRGPRLFLMRNRLRRLSHRLGSAYPGATSNSLRRPGVIT